MSTVTAFDDMPDDLSALEAAPSGSVRPTYTQPCPRCLGSGRYRGPSSLGSECFKCHGKGVLEFKLSPEQRVAGRAASERHKAKKLAESIASWKIDNAGAWSIMEQGRGDSFVDDMHRSLEQWGRLTDGQTAAILRKPQRDAEYAERKRREQEERVAKAAAAPTIDVLLIERAFAAASASGLRSPKLRLARFVFKPAKSGSANPGAIYAMDDQDRYLGKVLGGKFHRGRDCDDADEQEVLSVCAAPHEAAVAYGRMTGRCSCCALPLTNKLSIELGIGPICRAKYGWGA